MDRKEKFFATVLGELPGALVGIAVVPEVAPVSSSRIQPGRPFAWLLDREPVRPAAVVARPSAAPPPAAKPAVAMSSKPTAEEIQTEANKLSDFEAYSAVRQLVEESKSRKLNEEEAAGLAALNARADRQMDARQRASMASIQGLVRCGDRDAIKGLQALRIEALAPRRKESADGELHGKARAAAAFDTVEAATAKQPAVAKMIAETESRGQRMDALQSGGQLTGKAKMAAAFNRQFKAKGGSGR